MPRLPRLPRLAALALVCLLGAALAGCASRRQAIYDNEEFSSANTYSHSFPATGNGACEAARRALLSQGYIVSDSKPATVKGSKNFQRSADAHAEIEFTVVCAPDSEGSNSTTVFANAVRQYYSLKKSTNSASVGVGVLGSLSVPFGLSDDSLVKVGAETIESKKFYDQFFQRMESYLDSLPTDKPEKPAGAPGVAADVPGTQAPAIAAPQGVKERVIAPAPEPGALPAATMK